MNKIFLSRNTIKKVVFKERSTVIMRIAIYAVSRRLITKSERIMNNECRGFCAVPYQCGKGRF